MNKIKKTAKLVFLILLISYSFIGSKKVFANEYQKCYKEENCLIGEFLFDDLYQPIATAECRLTSRYPDGNVFINSELMSPSPDGWYSYAFIATPSAGFYRSQICCQTGNEYLCLDKSFKIEATPSALTKTDVASAVWNAQKSQYNQTGSFGESLQNIVPSLSDVANSVWSYSIRTLSDFGNLPDNIWNYSSRTLSSFGDLISNIWNFTNRTISNSSSSTTNNYITNNNLDTSSLAKKSDIESLKKDILYNQQLLEKAINKPIIKNYLEEEPDTNLETKIKNTQLLITKISAETYFIDSQFSSLDLKWSKIEDKEFEELINKTKKSINDLLTLSKNLSNSWNIEIIKNFNKQIELLNNKIIVIENDFKIEGKSKIVKNDIYNFNLTLNNLIKTLGNNKDSSEKNTIYGKINEIKFLAGKYDFYLKDVNGLLVEIEKKDQKTLERDYQKLIKEFSLYNKIPRFIITLNYYDYEESKKIKNQLLAFKSLVESNKKLLLKNNEKPFSNTWIEEGSMVFKTLLTNPSSLIKQKIPLKYYLPQEIKKEDIIDYDKNLKIEYDVEKKQFYVEGEFELAPNESKTVFVRVQDIWELDIDEIESLRRQVNELIKPLEKTTYFGQAITIKSNIDVILDKILANTKKSMTPDNKIKNYYETQIELESVKRQIKSLQDIVSQAGSFSSMAGFVGGAQVMAVWGLIIIMITGFVFLVIYMKVLNNKDQTTEEESLKIKKNTKKSINNEKDSLQANQIFTKKHLIRLAIIFFVLGSVFSLLISLSMVFVFNYLKEKNYALEKQKNIIYEKQIMGASDER